MNKSVNKGNTILVHGPASVTLVKGKTSVLGAPLKIGKKVIVRLGKTIPFEADCDSTYDIILGETAEVEEVPGSTIPESWKQASKEVLTYKKPCTVMVIGDVDSGKTTFCTFLANMALKKKLKTVIVDADLGQSELGPPTTLAMGLINYPLIDLFTVKSKKIHFVGSTSPSGVTDRVIQGLTRMKMDYCKEGADFAIVNTDGWVEGENAKKYKILMVETIQPRVVIGIQHEHEIEPILSSLDKIKDIKVLRLTTSAAVRKRNREERKKLRAQGYRKYLRGGKLRVLPINWMNFEYTYLGSGKVPPLERVRELEAKLSCKILYCEEAPHFVLLILGKREGGFNENNFKFVDGKIEKEKCVFFEGDEKGVLVALLDNQREFHGLGILHDIDYQRRALRIYTPYRGKVAIIQFGKIKLNRYGTEIGTTNTISI